MCNCKKKPLQGDPCCLRYSIRRKRPELWRRNNYWLLLHDNAPTHRSFLVQEEIARQMVTVLPTLRTHLISHHAIFVSFLYEVLLLEQARIQRGPGGPSLLGNYKV